MRYALLALAALVLAITLYIIVAPTDLRRAREMATHNPLFAIAGSDPDEIEKLVPKLEETAHVLATLQNSPEDKERVEKALFPLTFLRALVNAERARLAFVASGTRKDEEIYTKALNVLIVAYTHDLQAYREALVHYSNVQKIQFAGGLVTTQSIENAVQKARLGVEKTSLRLKERQLCLKGLFFLCKADDTVLPTLVLPPEITGYTSATTSKHIEDIRMAFMRSDASTTQGRLLVTAQSACVGYEDGPYPYILSNTGGMLPLQYVGNIFFFPVLHTEPGTFGRYLEDKQIPYSYNNVLAYYECPELGGLFGRLRALTTVAQILDLPQEVTDYEVESSLAKAAGAQKELEPLVLAVANKSAGLEFLIQSTITLNRNAATEKAKGVGGFDAAFLITYKSGFPLLFQTENRSFMSDVAVSVFETTARRLKLPTYFSLRDTYTDSEIIRLLSLWKSVHE